MSGGMTSAFDVWVKNVLGIDPSAPAGAATASTGADPTPDQPDGGTGAIITKLEMEAKRLEAAGTPSDPLDKLVAGLRAKFAKAGGNPKLMAPVHDVAVKALARVKADAERQANASTSGADKAIADLRDAAAEQIGKLDVANPDRKTLEAQLQALDAQIQSAGREPDPNKRGALRKAADQGAKDLLKAAAAAGGNSKEAKKAVQDAYKKALEEKYGITIGKHDTLVTDHTHLDQVYEMFEKVPLGHVAQDKLKDLSYNKRLMVGGPGNKHGIGLFTGASIQLGDYGDETWPYQDPNTGKTEKPNGFSVSVLHELGHSVDARWGIMDKYGADKGCGGWQSHTVAALAGLLAEGARAASGGIDAEVVQQMVAAALVKGEALAPDGVPADALRGLQTFLAPWIALRKSGSYKPTHASGDRAYFYRGAWRSYLTSARVEMHVTDYQWSAPPEWFAELYAICWYKGVPAPGSVHEQVRAYMPQPGGAASPGAPGPAN